MDPHAVNAMGMQGGMSVPMSMAMAGANGANPQAMGMGMNGMALNAYGVPQQQQQPQQMMMMNMNQMNMGSMAMKMNPNALNPPSTGAAGGSGMQVPGAQATATGADWRIQLTREHRANLIAKIYNEMVRVSADPVPGIKLWMNVSWYELTLYKESRTQEEYISKIFTRLKSLRAQQTDMNAVMAAQTLPNQGMLSRLDFSYYNTLNLNQRAGAPGANGSQVGGYPGHPQYGGPAGSGGAQPQPGKPATMNAGGAPANPAAPNGASVTPRTEIPEGGVPGDMTAEYWRQHAALKSKYHDDVEKVHSAFKKYVDHMKGHDETEQKKKLRYLLSYVQLCASILNEDKTTHAPRKIEELDKVYKYIVKIVNPYLKKLRTETDKRSFTPNGSSGSGPNPTGINPSPAGNPSASSGPPATSGPAAAPANTSGGPDGAMHMQHQQQQGQPNQQNMSLQQKQQQYLMQQRAQHMQQQQQRMQVQARQQQMMQQQHMMQQQKPQSNQANMLNAQQNSQTSGSQQTPQQKQQQQAQRPQQTSSGQQQSAQPQPGASQQPQQNRQPQPQSHPQQQSQPQQSQQSQQPKSQQAQHQQSAGNSRGETSSLNLDESLYGGMDSGGLLQMPSNLASSGSSSSGFMSFTNDLSPTNFSGMDLLDMDGFMGQDGNSSSGPGSSGQNTSNSSGGNNTNAGDGADSDLMFMEAL